MRALRCCALMGLSLFMLGGRCFEGDGSGGSPTVVTVSSPDVRCVAIPGQFPPGFDFVPGLPGRAMIANVSPSGLIPLDIESVPPIVPPGTSSLVIPTDSDGDGNAFEPPVILDDVIGVAPDLVLATGSLYEEVLFVHPDGFLRSFDVEVPASFGVKDFRFLPPPGSPPEARTALSTQLCLVPPVGATDSRGAPILSVLTPGPFCDPGTYPSTFTSGAAVAASRLFVSMSNLGEGRGSEDTQYLPGAVLVFDLDLGASPPRANPNAGTPAIFTSAFNPTHVTSHISSGGREFVLVVNSGAFGLVADDPNTSPIEAGIISLTPGSIDVIDAQRLVLVATIPLVDANPSFAAVGIDPTGRVALLGDVGGRRIFGVDLAALDSLPLPPDPLADSTIVLDGSTAGFDNAVIFDGQNPLLLPHFAGGAPTATCPGRVVGVAFSDAGDRAFAVETCDGALHTVALDLTGVPAVPVPASRFDIDSSVPITAPLRVDSLGSPRQPGAIKVRPGVPGVDYQGPDVFFSVGEPDGLLCGFRVDSPSP